MLKLNKLVHTIAERQILSSTRKLRSNVVEMCGMIQNRPFSQRSYNIVVIGGGSGGISVAARMSRYLRAIKKGKVAIVEPRKTHYYQPLWTLVGAGIKQLSDSRREMSSVIPKDVDWIQDACVEIDPNTCSIRLAGASGSINYDYLVVAAGINLDWHKVEGLTESLQTPGVCSNYSAETVGKTWDSIQNLKSGNAVFTFPNTPIKCAGAPQKIMYLTDAYLRKNGNHSKVSFYYNTSLPVIFGVKQYADALMEICKKRNLNVSTRLNLVRVDPIKKCAYFEHLDKPDEPLAEFEYEMLHVTPPMSAPKFLSPLANSTSNGYVAVDSKTLQHVKYKNIFALGDCSALPTSKTAAAIASQNYILSRNLLALIQNEDDKRWEYDGYTSCPLVTGDDKCILAEFDYKLQPLETFPFSQQKERTTMYYMKKDVLPFVYWNLMLRGNWSGPSVYRKLAHLGLSN